jgi:hypothetical protein
MITHQTPESQIILIADVVKQLPLEEFIKDGEKADLIGPIVDPTLWRLANENLTQILKLARCLKAFKEAATKAEAELCEK